MTHDLSDAPARTLMTVLRHRADEQGDRVVYTHLLDGEQDAISLTYAELWARSCAIAAKLRDAGLTGERALLLYPPGLDYAPALFGCFLAGVVAVPEGPPDPRRPERSLPRIRAVAGNSRVAAVLTIEALMEIRGAMPDSVTKARWFATDSGPADAAPPPTMPARDALAYLQYTSGSTADPRGVMITHENLAANCRAIAFTHQPADDSVMVSWVPTFHDLGLLYAIAMPVWSGFHGVSLAARDFAGRPVRWLRAIHRFRGTHSVAPDTAYAITAVKSTPDEREGLDLSTWRVALNGAEPIHVGTEERFVETFAPHGFRGEAFSHAWGMSEGTAKLTGERAGSRMQFLALDADALSRHQVTPAREDSGRTVRLASCGTTAPGTFLCITDPSTGEPSPPDRVGEIWVRGPSVGLGYWDAPEASAETFGARTADGAGPWLRTGDLGFLHEGRLFITGRIKEVLIIRGQNHYPQDLEASVDGRHPAIRPGATVAFSFDDGHGELVAVVAEVRPDRVGDDPEPVFGVIRAGLAVHGLRPARIALVAPGQLPRTTSGKLQRQRTRALLLDGTLPILHEVSDTHRDGWLESETTPARADEPHPPTGDRSLTALVAAAVARALGHGDVDRIDPAMDFMLMGLDSVMEVEVRSTLQQTLGLSLQPTVLFDWPSVNDLAWHLARRLDG